MQYYYLATLGEPNGILKSKEIMERVQKGVLEPKDSDLRKLYKNLLNNKEKNDLLLMRQGLTERLLTN